MTIRPLYYKDARGRDLFSRMERGDYPVVMALGFLLINYEKYLWRAGRKTDDPTEDLEKAETYVEEWFRLMKMHEAGQIHDGGEKRLLHFTAPIDLRKQREIMLAKINRARQGQIVSGAVRGRLNWGHDDERLS